MPIKALIFDFSGTLDNLDKVRLSAVNESLTVIRGVIPPEDRLKEAKEVIVEIFRLDNECQSASIKDIYYRAVSLKYPNVTHHELDAMWDIYNGYRKAHRGLLESFADNFPSMAQYKLFIVTRSREDTIRELLRKNNLEEHFTIFRTKKPSTETFIRIMDEYSLKPEECVMFGDDVTLDLMPAKMLGMKTVLRTGYVDCFINEFHNIYDILMKI